MNTLRAIRKLVLGETWLLPLGLVAIVAGAALVIKPLASGSWDHLGGFVLLVGVAIVLVVSVSRSARVP